MILIEKVFLKRLVPIRTPKIVRDATFIRLKMTP